MSLDTAKCRTISICLRVVQLILGFIAVGLAVNASTFVGTDGVLHTLLADTSVQAFIICTSAYLTPTFLLLVATCHRDSFENMRKSIFEPIYNVFGTVVHNINAIWVIKNGPLITPSPGLFYAAGAMALLNTVLYYVSFHISLKKRKA